jgi:hypothetical protein
MRKILAISLVMLMGCGDSKSDDKAASATPGPFEGFYKSPCIGSEEEGYSYNVLNAAGNTFSINIMQSKSSTCSPLESRIIQVYSATLQSTTVASEAAYNVDLNLTDALIMAATIPYADELNAAKAYGYTNWARDSSKSIIDKAILTGEQVTFKKNTKIYNIIKKVGNKIYLGNAEGANDGTTAAKRPTEFTTDEDQVLTSTK